MLLNFYFATICVRIKNPLYGNLSAGAQNVTCAYVIIIKTHDNESRGQEEAGRTRRMSVLFTGSTAVKFVKALNKLPLKLSLSYQGLSTF